jgi:hypothetical protein
METDVEGFEGAAKQNIAGKKSKKSLFKIGLLNPRGKVFKKLRPGL